ncbi:uncharacterized protein LOC122650772 [Telopea speciosissima]|uniref:uncharacterized protein LOC122650772 n=1 Tax=Telopea speciosissima TaxID=54955 RepID=UPI001CC5EEC1|nr:uncharacterized protein LOC122650772 [Telopea speciosissima]
MSSSSDSDPATVVVGSSEEPSSGSPSPMGTPSSVPSPSASDGEVGPSSVSSLDRGLRSSGVAPIATGPASRLGHVTTLTLVAAVSSDVPAGESTVVPEEGVIRPEESTIPTEEGVARPLKAEMASPPKEDVTPPGEVS